jgi:hypothetical protein
MPIFVFCPECKDFVPMKTLRYEDIKTEHFGEIQLSEYVCPKNHQWILATLLGEYISLLEGKS